MPAAADEFDDFYKSARTALLQQTFALTGDLPASRSAVRDAFVAAWHHWRKVSRLEDPEAWVRPLAWRHAQRRHSARIFHRDRKLDPEIRATLDALAKLPLAQRKVLLLTQLTDASMADMAREVGLPLHEAEQRLQTATSQFAMNRDVADDGHPPAVRATARPRVRRALATGHHRPPRRHRPAPYAHRRGRRRSRRRARARRRGRHRRPGREAVARERPQHRRRGAAPRPGRRRPGTPRRRPSRPQPTHRRSRSPRTTSSPSTSSRQRVPGRWRQAGTDGAKHRHPDALPVDALRRPRRHRLGRAAVQGPCSQGSVAAQHGAVGRDVDHRPHAPRRRTTPCWAGSAAAATRGSS